MNKNKAHDGRTRSFDELNFKEQAQAINMYRLNLKKMQAAHERRRKQLGK